MHIIRALKPAIKGISKLSPPSVWAIQLISKPKKFILKLFIFSIFSVLIAYLLAFPFLISLTISNSKDDESSVIELSSCKITFFAALISFGEISKMYVNG